MNIDDNTDTRQEKNEEEKEHFFWKAKGERTNKRDDFTYYQKHMEIEV